MYIRLPGETGKARRRKEDREDGKDIEEYSSNMR